MKTLIELYDEKAIHNVLGTEAFRPEQTVFLCSKEVKRRRRESLKTYFRERGCQTEIHFAETDMNDTEAVRSRLQQLLTSYPDPAVDIAGGTDAALFAAGSVCTALDVAAFTYSRRRNTFYEIQKAPYAHSLPCDVHLRVSDAFLMAGGSMLQGRMENHQLCELEDRILSFFEIYLDHRRDWADQISYIQLLSPEKGMHAEGPMKMRKKGHELTADLSLLRSVEKIGLIQNLHADGDRVSFRFLNDIARFALRDVGSVLELYIWKACRLAGVFDDICLSAVVNWEGDRINADSVTNEIDVACTRGVMPLFISCKTCAIKTEALNELAILRDRFGAPTARAMIVTSSLSSHQKSAMRRRASELDIAVVEQNEIRLEELTDRLRSLSEIRDKLQGV